jgi:2-polyprenyl-6-methoxyphenol hydroxylase-like FAD-dependent oxidoreductase
MQGKTEDVIYKRLEQETNCRINWATELVSYTQDATGVKSIVRDNITQEEKTIESKYIVGADGSHSRVRKCHPEWTYDGVALPTKFVLADLTVRGDYIEKLVEKMNAFTKGTSRLFV